jgi:hypothetical protein
MVTEKFWILPVNVQSVDGPGVRAGAELISEP